MTFTDKITPVETEEIKPGLFVQKTRKGWRQIHPAAWDGKINWKNFILGHGFFKNLIFVFILLTLVWAYQHDTAALMDFYTEHSDPDKFCRTYYDATPEEQADYFNKTKEDYERNTNFIRDYLPAAVTE